MILRVPICFLYSDIAMHHLLKPLIWKRFCDDLIGLWILDYLKTIDAWGIIKFTKETENENDLAFLDLILKLSSCKKSQSISTQKTLTASHILTLKHVTLLEI